MRDVKSLVMLMLGTSRESFPFFLQKIFPLSYLPDGYRSAPHTWDWAKLLQENNKVAILSARKHLKSTTIYAYLMWLLFHNGRDTEILYLSYKGDLAQYHCKNIKNLIDKNPAFDGIKDLKETSEGVMKYKTIGGHTFTVEPEGIMSFKRGRHPDIVICDDILADPTNTLNLTVIDKISRTFFEDVMSLPKEGGKIVVVGTAQHQEDLFFKLKVIPSWKWRESKAIIDEPNKKTLWPELFSFERLLEIRDKEIGEKAFNKEYMCSPVYSEDAFFKREEIICLINPALTNNVAKEVKKEVSVIAGLDIGKHAHPSHLAVFSKNRDGIYTEILSKFFDNVEYIKQASFINELIKSWKIDRVYFDNTRGEFEGFLEQGILMKNLWKPVRFGTQEKYSMAANFEKIVKDKKLVLINDDRQTKSVLAVNNELDALETSEGHGDAFWSISLALSEELVSRLVIGKLSTLGSFGKSPQDLNKNKLTGVM